MTSLRLILALLLLCAWGAAPHAQGEETIYVHERPLHVRHFSGTVFDARGMTVEYATVELRSPKDHHLLASTFADGKGNFTFDDRKYGKKVEVRAIQKGFNITQYTIIRKPFGDLHIRIVLTVAS